MRISKTKLAGVALIQHTVFTDERGCFYESYNKQAWQKLGLNFQPVQENYSYSRPAGTIRGLHYQLAPRAQAKAVRVITGAVFDVILDLRPESATFGSWLSVLLSEENKKTLFIPKGFAHGFCTLSPDTRVAYLTDDFYTPALERGVLWNDPALNIPWPVTAPLLSDKDTRHPPLAEADIK